MRTMARECNRPSVTAVHAYEDCSLLQFEEAKRQGSGRLSRLADWFKPSKHEDERLPMDARGSLGSVFPPPK